MTVIEHLVDPTNTDEDTREAYRQLNNRAAKAVGVVTAVRNGYDHARTVTDYISVSWDPPTMLVSLYSLGRMIESLEDAEHWGLSILSADQRGVAQWLGEPGTPLYGLMDNVPHFRREVGSPALISGAVAHFEMRTGSSFEVATHTLVAGEVVWMSGELNDSRSPLLRYDGEYSQVGG